MIKNIITMFEKVIKLIFAKCFHIIIYIRWLIFFQNWLSKCLTKVIAILNNILGNVTMHIDLDNALIKSVFTSNCFNLNWAMDLLFIIFIWTNLCILVLLNDQNLILPFSAALASALLVLVITHLIPPEIFVAPKTFVAYSFGIW